MYNRKTNGFYNKSLNFEDFLRSPWNEVVTKQKMKNILLLRNKKVHVYTKFTNSCIKHRFINFNDFVRNPVKIMRNISEKYGIELTKYVCQPRSLTKYNAISKKTIQYIEEKTEEKCSDCCYHIEKYKVNSIQTRKIRV